MSDDKSVSLWIDAWADHWVIPVPDRGASVIRVAVAVGDSEPTWTEWHRTDWFDSSGRPVYAPEGHDLHTRPPGTPRPTMSDELIEEHWRRYDAGELGQREFAETMARFNIHPLRFREAGQRADRADWREAAMKVMIGISVMCLVILVAAIIFKQVR